VTDIDMAEADDISETTRLEALAAEDENGLADLVLEPWSKVIEPLRARREKAEAALEAARLAEAEAFEAVDVARADLGMGVIARGVLLRKQRALAKCTEATANADALVRALERAEDTKTEARRKIESWIARDRKIREDATTAESAARRQELLAQALEALEAADDLPGLPPLERVSSRWNEIRWRVEEVARAHEMVATKRGWK